MAKKKDEGAYRMNISIPAELKERMDEHGTAVNWSGVAAAAFEKKLSEVISQTKEEVSMEEVIRRLRHGDEAERQEITTQGRLDGKDWAAKRAVASELRRLGAIWSELDTLPNDAIANTVAKNYDSVDDFWHTEAGEEYWSGLDDETGKLWYGEAFIEGAMEVWDAVKNKL